MRGADARDLLIYFSIDPLWGRQVVEVASWQGDLWEKIDGALVQR